MRKGFWGVSLAIILCLMLAVSPVLGAAAMFKDIGASWAKSDIEYLVGKGWITGYSDGTFKPDQPATRAVFITVLMRALGSKAAARTTPYFKDMKNHWAGGYVTEAVQKGILYPSEYPSGLKPDKPIYRSEAAAIMIRALRMKPDNGPTDFKDQVAVNKSMYKGYIKVAYDEGLMFTNTSGEFRPLNPVSRAETCDMLVALLPKLGSAVVAAPNTTPTTNTVPTTSTVSGSYTSIVVWGKRFNIAATPTYVKIAGNEVRVNTLAKSGTVLKVNNTHSIILDSAQNNPDLILFNKRYVVSKYSVVGSDVVVTPTCMKLSSVAISGLKYNADYVKLYITGPPASSGYLSDAIIVDQSFIKIGDKTYNVASGQAVLALGGKYFVIQKINMGSGETTLDLVETKAVVLDHPEISDISQINLGNSQINLTNISSINFYVDGYKYPLNSSTIDTSGNITLNSKNYVPSQVIMEIGSDYYKIDDLKIVNGKLIFYISTNASFKMARINGAYRDVSGVKYVKDSQIYDFNNVIVVSKNIIRIGGVQKKLDATVKIKMDNKLYDITEIDYDITLDMVTMTINESAVQSDASLPAVFIFYVNGAVYQDGASSDVLIYTDRWVTFTDITVAGPARFVNGGKAYDLIGARVKIGGTEFTVIDTAWRGRTLVFEIYLQKV
ncbi:MAG: S-layer homology domain-containing protein [Candidatus Saccharibacteria bacterium]